MAGRLKFSKQSCEKSRRRHFTFGAAEIGAAVPMAVIERNEAASMFGSLKNFIVSLVGDTRLHKSEDRDCQLATAALLARVATVDSEMSEARREKLRALLKSHFGLDDLAVAQLIRDATEAARSAVDLYHFTRQLNSALDNEGRQYAVKMMWQVVYVDGHANEFESNIIWRSADLLGVSSRQRIELRQLVASDRAAPNPILL